MRLGVGASLVGKELVSGDVEIADGRVEAVGIHPAGSSGIAVPGFVDLQVNGFAGVDFLDCEPIDYAVAGRALAATGVTAFQPTFISSPLNAYARALAVASEGLAHSPPRVLGVHLEGPFISPDWSGAHNPSCIIEPDVEVAAELVSGAFVTYMTVAPERPGAGELIDMLVARNIIVACGHSDADADTANAAFDRGARAITHIYNAHRRWQSRDPGIAGVALTRPDVSVEAIVDNVHLSPEAAHAAYLCARDRFVIVTDSIAATELGAGTYRLGDREVRVTNREARLGDGTLAGSVLTMDAAVRNLVSLGIAPVNALLCASTHPAKVIGRKDVGHLRPGGVADLVVLDDALCVKGTLVGGVEVFSA